MAIVILVHQGQLVLRDLQSARYAKRAQKRTYIIIVHPVPRVLFNLKLVRRLVNYALRDLLSLKSVKRLVHPVPREVISLKSVRQLVHRALRDIFNLKLVMAIVILVHQGQLVLRDLQSARYAKRAQKRTYIIIVHPVPRVLFNIKLVRRLVNCALRDLFSLKSVKRLVHPVPRELISLKSVRQLVHRALKDIFNLKLVLDIVILVHQGQLVLRDLQIAGHAQRVQKRRHIQQLVNLAPRDIISPKQVRQLVSSALKEHSSPPMGKRHVDPAPPAKPAYQGPRNAFHVRKGHFPMKLQEVVNHVTTT